MSTRWKYQYTIVRFVPNQLRGEFLNVGVILHVVETGELHVEWLKDFSRLRQLSNNITSEEWKNFKKYLAENYKQIGTQAILSSQDTMVGEPISFASSGLLDYFYKEYTGQFQFTEPLGGITENPHQQLLRYYDRMVKPITEEEESNLPITRLEKVRKKVSNYLDRAGLLAPDKIKPKIQIDGKTSKWEFDFGRVNGSATLVEVISLDLIDFSAKSDRAFSLIGRVRDVRSSANPVLRNTQAYSVIHQTADPLRMEGTEEAKKLLENEGIEVVQDNDIDYLVKGLHRDLQLHPTTMFHSLN